MKIITNNHWHNFLYGYELTDKEKREFDYLDDIDFADFIRYRGCLYDPGEFMRVDHIPEFEQWQGYQSDSYFSGVLLRYSRDCEQYQIATYIS